MHVMLTVLQRTGGVPTVAEYLQEQEQDGLRCLQNKNVQPLYSKILRHTEVTANKQ